MPKQAVAVELYYDGAWHDLVTDDDVLADTPIVIKRGQGEESAAPRPASVSLRLANDDDRYRVSNPQSPLYGKAGRNTPIRVSVGDSVRAVAEASSWSSGESRYFRSFPRRGAAWTEVEAGGLLQRVSQWSQPLRSAIYRAVDRSGVTPAEYWPMEDDPSATSAASAVDGPAMTPVTAVRYTLPSGEPLPPGGSPRFADGAGIGGSAPLPSFQGGGTLAAPIRRATFDGYAVDWVMQFQPGADEGGTTSADVLRWTESGTYVTYTVNVTSTSVTVFHADSAAAATLSSSGSATALMSPYDGTAHHFRYQVRQNGANYSATLYVDGTSADVADNFGAPMAGTVGSPLAADWNPGEQTGDFMPVAAGHLIVWASGQLGDQPAIFNALDGYRGERAALRFARLMGEEGLDYYVSTGYDSSAEMGPQRPDTLINLIVEAARTDDALLFDLMSEVRIYFVCRVDRYNRSVAADLTPDLLPWRPPEVTDDLGIHNVVTVSQREGGDSTARDDSTPLVSTQPPPDGAGEYQQRIEVNIADEDDLPQYAGWWLSRGTVTLPRFPQVTVNMAALDAVTLAGVESVDVGDVITITGMREYVIRLQVIGYTETIGTHSRSIAFTCVPDQQFVMGIYDDTYSRWDLRTCTLSGDHSSTTTSLSLAITSDESWSTTATPYNLMFGGEEVTVTAMGARSGSGPYAQTATVVRSVNGIVKPHSTGTEVHVSTPGRWAL